MSLRYCLLYRVYGLLTRSSFKAGAASAARIEARDAERPPHVNSFRSSYMGLYPTPAILHGVVSLDLNHEPQAGGTRAAGIEARNAEREPRVDSLRSSYTGWYPTPVILHGDVSQVGHPTRGCFPRTNPEPRAPSRSSKSSRKRSSRRRTRICRAA